MATFTEISDKAIQRVDANAADAETWTTYTQDTMTALAAEAALAIDLSGIIYDPTYGADPVYSAPSTPVEPDYSTTGPQPPTLTPIPEVTPVAAIPAPAEPAPATGPSDPTLPTVADIVPLAPGDAPDDTIQVDDTPGSAPASGVSAVPALAALQLPTFDSDIPTIDIDELVAEYLYVEPTYIDQLKEETKAVLTSVLAGNLVVSDTVWDSIWDRAAGDAARVQSAEEWAASNLTASLGMTGLPNETLLSRLDAAEQEGAKKLSSVRLEQSIQEAQQKREDLWNGVKDAIAFEGMWLQHHEALAGRALASAAKAHEALISTYNANIARWNLILSRSAHEVAIGRLQLDTALAELQEYAARLDKVRVEIQVDDMAVKRWLGEWEGWKTEKGVSVAVLGQRVQAYTSEWQADKARHGGDVDLQRLFLSSGDQSIQEFSAKWNGIGTQIGSLASHLNARTGAYSATTSGNIGIHGSEVNARKLTVETNDQWLRQFETEWRGVDIQSSATSKLLAARTGVSALENDASRTELEYSRTLISKEQSDSERSASVAIQKAEMQTKNNLGTLGSLAELQSGLAQAYLSASDTSVGTSAPISQGEMHSYSYDGDA